MAIQTALDSISNSSGSPFGFKNRIINGAMVIDQRNAGAAVTATGYFVDRFSISNATDGAFSVQQDSSAPVGFVNSIKYTTTTADATLTTTQQTVITHGIEGTNVSDLAWGTANAQTVTLSFWVQSSLTGTFGGSLRNSGNSRSYPFTYTISTVDTWEYKTVTIAGDTSGTWLTTTGLGIQVIFGLGVGPDRSGTAGAWNSNNNTSATGAVSVIGTLNATWYVTGVQLEKGSTATSFDYRPYGTELAVCQRYYQRQTRTAGVSDGINFVFCMAQMWSNTYQGYMHFPVTMRSAPSFNSSAASTFQFHSGGVASAALTSVYITGASIDGTRISGGTTYGSTAGFGAQIATSNSSTAFLDFSAEL